jgi:hypothetical protein
MEMKTGINFMTNLSLVVIYLTCGQISSGGEEMLPRVASLGVLFGHTKARQKKSFRAQNNFICHLSTCCNQGGVLTVFQSFAVHS